MFVAITNTPRDYAWGSAGEISALLDRAPTDALEAELWLGTHPGSPSVVADGTLLEVTAGRLPFLLKVLAASSTLSLQAHPTREQAAEGFARENAEGIPIDAPHRNYKDPFHKPELLYALSDEFHALCGFRGAESIHHIIGDLISRDADSARPERGPLHRWLDRMGGDESIQSVFEWLVTRGEGVDDLVRRVTELAGEGPLTPELETVRELAAAFPGDPGIVISLMLHRVTLARGEVLYLPAGNIHAYLRGVGIELMAASDNVLRGGLTGKHVDVDELRTVLDFRPLPVPLLAAEHPAPGVERYRPDVPDFELFVVHEDADLDVGPAIALCVDGEFALADAGSGFRVSRGDAVYLQPDGAVKLSGAGTLFLATAQRS